MIISYQWLMHYLPEPLPVADLSSILTSIGLEVEAVEISEAVSGSLEGLVIGEVLSCEKHPNADKLRITTVDIGSGTPLTIVCGAPNVTAGQRVVVAPAGVTVHPAAGAPFQIKKAKIRGEESQGMICAEDEIGMGNGHDGIMVLPADAPIGTPARSYFAIPEADYAIHIGLTPNRADAMNHIGVARDVCAYLSHHRGKSYKALLPFAGLPPKAAELDIAVHVDAPEACARYAGLTIGGIRVGPSPDWLRLRLKTIGVRSINNVVDITNFVLHEFGQPLHAFDADRIGGRQIHVRFLPRDTVFTTLDGQERKLRDTDLMICDDQEGMCIAGVFGGNHSGVTDQTSSIFLESAYFDPTHVRRTSLHHGLRTDAATHFEKGVDINNLIPALKRAASLIVEIAGGAIASDLIDIYPEPVTQKKVNLSYSYVNRLAGKDYAPETVNNILFSLGFEQDNPSQAGTSAEASEITLLVPTNKVDVSLPADIVEEVLRIDGLDNIATPNRLNISLQPSAANDRHLREQLANLLCGEGFQEIVTNSIVNSKYYPERKDLVRMLNSLSSELDIMRPSMLESGLEVIQYNCNRKSTDLLLFESGNVYTREAEKFKEEAQLALWITGNVRRAHWNQKAGNADLFYLKGVLQNLVKRSGLTNITIGYEEGNVTWKHKNQVLCRAARVSEQRLREFEIRQDVFFAVIRWDAWTKASAAKKIRFREVPRFPAVERDLAIILDRDISYQQVEEATGQLKIDALREFDLFDVFESEKLGQNKKSYALNYTFQLHDRTLTDTEIDQSMQQLMQTYRTKLGAQIRE